MREFRKTFCQRHGSGKTDNASADDRKIVCHRKCNIAARERRLRLMITTALSHNG